MISVTFPIVGCAIKASKNPRPKVVFNSFIFAVDQSPWYRFPTMADYLQSVASLQASLSLNMPIDFATAGLKALFSDLEPLHTSFSAAVMAGDPAAILLAGVPILKVFAVRRTLMLDPSTVHY